MGSRKPKATAFLFSVPVGMATISQSRDELLSVFALEFLDIDIPLEMFGILLDAFFQLQMPSRGNHSGIFSPITQQSSRRKI